MRPFLARFSEPVGSVHTPSRVDFITIMPVFKFSVHTGMYIPENPAPMMTASNSKKVAWPPSAAARILFAAITS
jgi:hypothetical protein